MIAFLIVIYSICGIYLVLNFKHDLHMLQQNSYRISRYWRYLSGSDISSMWRIADVAILFIVFSRLLGVSLALLFTAIFCVCKIGLILKKKFKKPLVFTPRVWRIYTITAAIGIGLYLWAIFTLGFSEEQKMYYSGPVLTIGIMLLLSIFSWITVIMAVGILAPVEKMINQRYYKDAKRILRGMPSIKVVGITGSYGKTSTKYFLERILSEKFNVLMTPGSYNTLMGVIRTIREHMKPYTDIFICEMGAKQKGDIKEICELVHPEIGIITAVGPMHLETFKTLENIQSTKFELIDSLPSDGLGVINNDFELCAARKVDNVKTIRYSVSDGKDLKADFLVSDIVYSQAGSTFKLTDDKSETVELSTKLVGAANISNIVGAVIVARRLGMTYGEIKRGVAALNQVEHRLSIKTTPAGVTIIDDAFNSNPFGSKMALDVLAGFVEKGRRIVVTPGMIELGSEQFELNRQLGKDIAKSTDIAVVVGHYNRQSIEAGIREAGYIEDNLYLVDSFNEAQKLLGEILRAGDTVLYENDLPDSFK